MIWLFFTKILCLDIKNPKVISLKQNEEIQLFEVENDKLRLRLNKDKSFKVGDKNVVTLETDGDLFLIKFSSGKYLFKTKQNNIVVDEIKAFALNNLDPIQGLKWDIKETEHGFKIESDGVCLEKSSSTGIANEFFVDAKDCSNTPNQNFNFTDISSTDMALEEKVQNEYIQEEGPTINPIIHGINNKRDPYMYGNEPFRGKNHKLE